MSMMHRRRAVIERQESLKGADNENETVSNVDSGDGDSESDRGEDNTSQQSGEQQSEQSTQGDVNHGSETGQEGQRPI